MPAAGIHELHASCTQPRNGLALADAVGVYGATLWRGQDSSTQLVPVAQLKHDGIIHRCAWQLMQLQPHRLLLLFAATAALPAAVGPQQFSCLQ